jgi:hypothetical protein
VQFKKITIVERFFPHSLDSQLSHARTFICIIWKQFGISPALFERPSKEINYKLAAHALEEVERHSNNRVGKRENESHVYKFGPSFKNITIRGSQRMTTLYFSHSQCLQNIDYQILPTDSEWSNRMAASMDVHVAQDWRNSSITLKRPFN